MEWVETTGKSLDEAKSAALDQLGVAEDDAEFEILDEPKAGLFGRVRGEARVRARVRPAQVRTKPERRERRKKDDRRTADGESTTATSAATPPAAAASAPASAGSDSTPGERGAGERGRRDRRGDDRRHDDRRHDDRPERGASDRRPESSVSPEQVGEEARAFVQGLVEAFGGSGTVTVHGEGTELEVRVEGGDVGLLVGPRGATLQAVQDLARVASQRRLGDHETRLRVDIGGYRERRQQALAAFAEKMADEVRSSGTARVLEPMGSADRKAIHDALSAVDGIATRSEGDDPFRRVVIAPA